MLATRRKVVRAEPIAALYEQQKVHHVDVRFHKRFDRSRAGYSPDHVGALVWALKELCEPSSEVQIWDIWGKKSD